MKSDAAERAQALLAMAADGLTPTAGDFARVADGLEVRLGVADAAAGPAWEAELASDLASQGWSLAGRGASTKLGLVAGVLGVAVSASWWWAGQPAQRDAQVASPALSEQAQLAIELAPGKPLEGRQVGADAELGEAGAPGVPAGAAQQAPREEPVTLTAAGTQAPRVAAVEGPDGAHLQRAFVEHTPSGAVVEPHPAAATAPRSAHSPEQQSRPKGAPRKSREAPARAAVHLTPPVAALPAELRLIQQASRALDAGEAQRALKLLARHRRDYPDGDFRIERDGLTAVAGCATGTAEASREQAHSFLARHPTSPLATRVRQACLPR